MTLITLHDLTTAIQKILNITREEAMKYATMIMDFFGFDDRIIDNVLTPQERQLFYRLQEKGVLSAEREETVLPTGNPWRIHYWLLEKQLILRYSQKNYKSINAVGYPLGTKRKTVYEDLYQNMPRELWSARKIPEA